jgi:hypothetical protein
MSTFTSGPGGDLGGSTITTTNSASFGVVSVGENLNPAAPADGDGGILYAKADGKLYWISNELAETDLTAGGGGLTEEQVEDIVGGMVTGGTETGISVTYTDGAGSGDGVLNFVVDDLTVAGDSGSTAMTMGDTLTISGGTNCTTSMSGDTLTINASGSSSTAQHVYTVDGHARISSAANIYAHNWAGSNQERYWGFAIGTSITSPATGDTLSVSVQNSGAYFQLWSVPAGMEIQSIRVDFYQAGYTARWRCRLWKCTPTDNSNANMTWTAIGAGAVNATAVNAKWAVASEDLSADGNRTIAAGDILGITWDGKDIDGVDYASGASGPSFAVSVLANFT